MNEIYKTLIELGFKFNIKYTKSYFMKLEVYDFNFNLVSVEEFKETNYKKEMLLKKFETCKPFSKLDLVLKKTYNNIYKNSKPIEVNAVIERNLLSDTTNYLDTNYNFIIDSSQEIDFENLTDEDKRRIEENIKKLTGQA